MRILNDFSESYNEYNISFSLVAHLLFGEELPRLVRSETGVAWTDEVLDGKYLCANSPVLGAMFTRLYDSMEVRWLPLGTGAVGLEAFTDRPYGAHTFKAIAQE